MESGQKKAAIQMQAARRSHFIARIRKYEAKVRKGQKPGSVLGERVHDLDGIASIGTSGGLTNLSLAEKHVVPELSVCEPCHTARRHHEREGTARRHHEGELVLRSQHEGVVNICRQLESDDLLEQEHIVPENRQLVSPPSSSASSSSPTGSPSLRLPSSSFSSPLSSSSYSGMLRAAEAFTIHPLEPASEVCPIITDTFEHQVATYIDLTPSATMQLNIADIAALLNVRVKAADMAAPMQEHAFYCTRTCLDALDKLNCKRLACTVKKEFDRVYGPAWHCIVGTRFGSYVTHSLGGFIYFSLGRLSVLLFKTTVKPIEQ